MNSNRLIEIRENADLNQENMAEILKTSQSNYSRWENGTEFIPLKKLNIFCNYFDVSMDYVIGLTRTNNPTKKINLKSTTIGNNLKTTRKTNNLTQKELADILNTSQSTICSYESGNTTLLTAFAIQIVKKFKISLDWLCGRK